MIDEAIKLSTSPPASLLLLRRTQIKGYNPPSLNASAKVKEYDWKTENEKISNHTSHIVKECIPVKSSDGLYILYTSGTTAAPKGCFRTSGPYTVALRYSMQHTFGMTSKDTFFCASDLGWVVGEFVFIDTSITLV